MKPQTYAAIDGQKGLIFEAYNKKQLKKAGVDMSLRWARYNSYFEALLSLRGSFISNIQASKLLNVKIN